VRTGSEAERREGDKDGRTNGRQNDQPYCDLVKLGDQFQEIDPKDTKKADELYQQMAELAGKLGPEYIALVGGLQAMDPDSKGSKEIDSTLDALDKLCTK
jgi:hypothetical protein